MNKSRDTNIILGVLLAIACIIIGDTKCNQPHPETYSDTLYYYDTNTYTRYKDSITPYLKITQRVELKRLYDTIQVIKEFFTQNIYKDTLSDSNIFLVITDTIFKNKINGRGYSYNLLKPQQVIVNTTINKYKPLTFGVQAGYGITSKGLSPYVGVGLSYRINFRNK